MSPATILLADDHTVLRDALKQRLNSEPDMRVVADVGTTDEAVTQVVRLNPDVVVMDINLPGVSCFEAARVMHSRCSGVRVVFLSGYDHDTYIEQALTVAACGFVLKTESLETIVAAIRQIAAGDTWYSPEVQQRIVFAEGHARLATAASSRLSGLSEREIEVLRHIALGLSMKQIARTMSLSEHTVHRHTTRLMQKLAIHDRVQLARYAIREGLAPL